MFRCYASIAPLAVILFSGFAPAFAADEPIALGTRRELFVDRFLIEKLAGQRLTLNLSASAAGGDSA